MLHHEQRRVLIPMVIMANFSILYILYDSCLLISTSVLYSIYAT